MGLYIIMCHVSGGRTGARSAALKRDGVEAVFVTREDAQREAARLTEYMNSPYSSTVFTYVVGARGETDLEATRTDWVRHHPGWK